MRLQAAAMLVLSFALAATAQVSLLDEGPKEFVASVPAAQMVDAGKQQEVELLFRVRDGFHINSHTPKSKLLIQTELTLSPVAGMMVGKIRYPQGQPYAFSFDPQEKLDVYSGELRLVAPMSVKVRGSYMLRGELRYQACDNASCYAPQVIPVRVEITAR